MWRGKQRRPVSPTPIGEAVRQPKQSNSAPGVIGQRVRQVGMGHTLIVYSDRATCPTTPMTKPPIGGFPPNFPGGRGGGNPTRRCARSCVQHHAATLD